MVENKRDFRGVVLVLIISVIGCAFLFNSKEFKEYKETVYSEFSESFTKDYNVITMDDIPVVEDVPQVEEKEAVEVAKPNFTLTVDTDVTIPSNVSAEDIDKMLEGTALHGLGKTYVEAEKKYGVNALYLVGLACVESGYGKSKYATQYYNLYGYGAVDSNPDLARHFTNWETGTLYVAERLHTNYLTPGGAYYEGKRAKDIDVHYCTDKLHANKIADVVSNLVKKLG